MIASLPMYDWPETREHNDQFWHRLQTELRQICTTTPAQLSRSDEHKQWQRNDVLLSQTCGYPLVTSLPETTVVVGTPLYGCQFCENGHYASAILVRQSDHKQALSEFAASTLAFNSTDSQSGYNSFKSLLIQEQLIGKQNTSFFSNAVCTGSHRASIEAVAHGMADICAVDPVSWALAQRFDETTQLLRILTNTAFTPALPLISSVNAIPHNMNEQQWRVAVMHAFEQAIDADAKRHLLIEGVTFISKSHYLELPISNLDMLTQS